MSAAKAPTGTSNVGRKNIFTCMTCRGHIVTIDVSAGTAPLTIGCHSTLGCKGTMRSSLYNVFDQSMRPDMEFYLPPAAQMLKTAEAKIVADGGLLLRFPPDAPKSTIRRMAEVKIALGEIERLAETIYRSEDLEFIATASKEVGMKAAMAARSFGEQQ